MNLPGDTNQKHVSVDSEQVANAGVFLLREDGAALMQHRDDKPGLRRAGMWVPPGGRMESGESPEECARREFLEETRYQCGELHWLDTFEEYFDKRWPPFPVTIYWAIYDGLQILECMEGQAVEFIERQRAADYRITEDVIELWDRAISEGLPHLKLPKRAT